MTEIDYEKEVEILSKEVVRMYKLFDDMSTASDMYKPENTQYVNHIGRLISKGLNNSIITTDGYNLYRKNNGQ